MSKETKIGLLVGLVFIVAFAMVVSELIGTNHKPPVSIYENSAQAQAQGQAPGTPFSPVSTPGRQVAESGDAPRQVEDPPTLVARGQGDDRGGMVDVMVRPGAPRAGGPRPQGVVVVENGGGREDETFDETTVFLEEFRSIEMPAPRRRAEVSQEQGTGRGERPVGKLYKVQRGDTLYGIAAGEYGPARAWRHKDILQANADKLSAATDLREGMTIVIPPLEQIDAAPQGPRPVANSDPAPRRRVYKVQPGDSLYKIGQKVDVSAQELLEANRDKIRDVRALQIGTELVIPS